MDKRFSVTLDISSFDYAVLCSALISSRSTKVQISDFYTDNPEEPVLTPLAPLHAEIDALDRLIHIFKESGEVVSDVR